MIHEAPWPTDKDTQKRRKKQNDQMQPAFDASTVHMPEIPAWVASLPPEQRQYIEDQQQYLKAAQQIALEERELRQQISNENQHLRADLNQAKRIVTGLLPHRQAHYTLAQQAAQFEKRYQSSITDFLNGDAKTVPISVYQKLLRRFKLLRNSPWKPSERVTIDEVQFQLTHPQKVDADGFARINYESGARHTGMSGTTIKRNIQSILEQCSTFPLECKWDVPDTTADGRQIKALYAKATVPDLVTIAPTLTLDAKRKQGGDQYTHQCQHCLSFNIKIRKKVTSTIICLDCHHETLLDETVTEQIQKVQSAQKQLAFGRIYHAGYRQPGTLELIDQALADHPELVLVDIRYTPESTNSQWTKSAFFNRYGDRYTWLRDLGNINHKEPGNIRLANPERGIAKLTEMLATHSVILLCGCPEYENCHRKSVIELYVQKQLAFDPHFCPHIDNLQAIITIDPPTSRLHTEPAASEGNEITQAAQLLLEIAGPDPAPIEMSRTGRKKYYPIDPRRPLKLADLVDHLRGGKARGALCVHGDLTRALCFDADTAPAWQQLRDAAFQLAKAGYVPLLEESPAGRGGHLWIIFDALVNAAAARAAVLAIAPELAEVMEYWPGPTGNRVRLPGGKYVRLVKTEREISAWCKLVNVQTGEQGRDGLSSARLLLASLSPAAMVPPISSELAEEKREGEVCTPATEPPGEPVCEQPVAPASGSRPLPKVDAAWIEAYGPVETVTFWFAVTEDRAAAWFNEHHPLESIRPRERNGMALSPNGDERTASTSYHQTAQGERYTDHSQHGRRPDGTKDSGDALELACKIWGESKAVLLKRAAGEIVARARAAMTAAARAGELPPAWVCELMTPAGWRKYDELAARKKMERQPAGSAEPERAETRPVVAPVPAKPLDKADEIKAWAKTHDWPAFEVNGRLLIAAGQSNWLHILLMAGYRDVQDRVYAEIQRRASEAAAPAPTAPPVPPALNNPIVAFAADLFQARVHVVAPDQGH